MRPPGGEQVKRMKKRYVKTPAQITAAWARKYPCAADRDEVRQLGAIAEWQARAGHDPARGPLENHVNSKVRWGIQNGMRDWLQLAKACKPRHLNSYCTITDSVDPCSS